MFEFKSLSEIFEIFPLPYDILTIPKKVFYKSPAEEEEVIGDEIDGIPVSIAIYARDVKFWRIANLYICFLDVAIIISTKVNAEIPFEGITEVIRNINIIQSLFHTDDVVFTLQRFITEKDISYDEDGEYGNYFAECPCTFITLLTGEEENNTIVFSIPEETVVEELIQLLTQRIYGTDLPAVQFFKKLSQVKLIKEVDDEFAYKYLL